MLKKRLGGVILTLLMTFIELKKEVDTLDASDQDKLSAYLTMLRKSRDDTYGKMLSERISDSSPGSWVSLDDFKNDIDE